MRLPLSLGHYDPAEIENRLREGSFVSLRHRLLYIDTPKVACTTLKWLLARIEGYDVAMTAEGDESQLAMCIHYRHIHPLPSLLDLSPAIAEEVLTSPAYRRFCVVRNPYSRLLSAWADKIRQIEPGFAPVCRSILDYGGDSSEIEAPTFRQFAEWVVATNDSRHCDAHWRTQRSLTFPGAIRYSHVMRYESLESDLQRMFDEDDTTRPLNAAELLHQNRYNTSLPFASGVAYGESLATKVAAFYDEDFTEFVYPKDSWKTIVAVPATSVQLEGAAVKELRSRNAVIARLSAELAELRAKAKSREAQNDNVGE